MAAETLLAKHWADAGVQAACINVVGEVDHDALPNTARARRRTRRTRTRGSASLPAPPPRPPLYPSAPASRRASASGGSIPAGAPRPPCTSDHSGSPARGLTHRESPGATDPAHDPPGTGIEAP